MTKYAIVDENGNQVFSTKSQPKVVGYMIFNTVNYDTETYVGTLADGRKVHFETFESVRCVRK